MNQMTNQPLVSIVTPSYNQGKFLERTIRSVVCQNYPNIEYIIVDALSTDETPAILQKYSRYLSKVVREKDDGQADAINKGFKLARGRILAYLNSDDCYASERVVSDVVRIFENNSDADLIYGRRYTVDQDGFYLHAYPFRRFRKREVLVADYIPQECCFWTKEIYDKCGGYVDHTFKFAMDYELWLRFLKNGAKFLSVDSTFGLFRKHDEQKTEAAWTQHGLPEIARLQQEYLGRVVSEKDMQLSYVAHYMGIQQSEHFRQSKLFTQLWGQLVRRNRLVFGVAPLDVWTVGVPLNRSPK